MIVTHGDKRYHVGQLVAEAASYRLYLCNEEQSDRRLLLQIAGETAQNGGLERSAFLLRELTTVAQAYEAKHAELEPGRLLSYERLFPVLLDGFRIAEQGNRRANILAFAEVDDPRHMVPLSNLADRDDRRISLPSSAWVMGRLLKLLDFVHGQGIAIRALSGNNVLIEPSRHFALVFDWSSALTHQGSVPRNLRRQEIAQAAQAVYASIGGDPTNGEYPYDAGADQPYVSFLWDLANGAAHDAIRVHHQFYDLVEELWGRSFRPFETLPL